MAPKKISPTDTGHLGISQKTQYVSTEENHPIGTQESVPSDIISTYTKKVDQKHPSSSTQSSQMEHSRPLTRSQRSNPMNQPQTTSNFASPFHPVQANSDGEGSKDLKLNQYKASKMSKDEQYPLKTINEVVTSSTIPGTSKITRQSLRLAVSVDVEHYLDMIENFYRGAHDEAREVAKNSKRSQRRQETGFHSQKRNDVTDETDSNQKLAAISSESEFLSNTSEEVEDDIEHISQAEKAEIPGSAVTGTEMDVLDGVS